MSAVLYDSYKSMVWAVGVEKVPVDRECQAKITCYGAPVGVVTGDYNERDRFETVAVLINEGDGSEPKPLLVCEDCAGWLTEAANAVIVPAP
jgi:hypothetical protein